MSTQSDALYSSFSQIHRAIVQYSSTTTGEIQVIIPSVTGNDTTVPISFFGRKEHPFENDWVVPSIGDTIIVCREDEDYTNTFWINTTYNPVRATGSGEANPTSYHFGPHGSETGAFDLIDYAATPTSSGLFMGSVNMGYYNHTATEWRTYMDYNGNFYLRGSGTNALTWNGSTLAVSGAITASTIDIGTGNTILKVDTAGNLSIGHATPSSAPFQVSNAGAVSASNLTITGGGININSGVFAVTSAGALTATNATITGDITANSGSFTGTVNAGGGTFSGSITASGTISGGNISGAAVSGSTITSSSMTAGTNAWHLDASGNMWWGNFGSYSAAAAGDTTYISAAGAIRATNLAITGGSINIDANFTVTSAGAITAVSGTIGGWSLSSTKIYKNTGTDEVRLDASQHIISARGGVAVLRGYDNSEDIRIGIAGDTAYEPSYNQVDDVAMTRESGVIRFSVEQALTVNDGVVTIASPSLTGNPTAPTQSSGNNSTRIATTAYVDAAGGGDHGGLTGLGDNDHPQYSLTSHNHSGVYATSGHNHSGVYLELGGGTMTGVLNLGTGTKKIEGGSGGGLMIDSTGNAYLRANDEGNYGVTAWTGGQTTIYHSTAARIQTGSSANVSYVTWEPSSNNFSDLGSTSKWWNYSYHYKMDTSALPVAAGSGWYMWFNTSDQVMKASSSERIKKDIVTVPTTEALDRIKALRPVDFSAKTNPSDLVIDDMWEYKRYRGFIAEEAAAVDKDYGLYNWWKSNDPESEDYDKTLPSLSSLQKEWTDEEVAEYYDLDEAKPQMFDLHAILADSVGAIQELSTKLDAAEARIAVLETT